MMSMRDSVLLVWRFGAWSQLVWTRAVPVNRAVISITLGSNPEYPCSWRANLLKRLLKKLRSLGRPALTSAHRNVRCEGQLLPAVTERYRQAFVWSLVCSVWRTILKSLFLHTFSSTLSWKRKACFSAKREFSSAKGRLHLPSSKLFWNDSWFLPWKRSGSLHFKKKAVKTL